MRLMLTDVSEKSNATSPISIDRTWQLSGKQYVKNDDQEFLRNKILKRQDAEVVAFSINHIVWQSPIWLPTSPRLR